MGSHSVTCHPAKVTFRLYPSPSWYTISQPSRDARLSWPWHCSSRTANYHFIISSVQSWRCKYVLNSINCWHCSQSKSSDRSSVQQRCGQVHCLQPDETSRVYPTRIWCPLNTEQITNKTFYRASQACAVYAIVLCLSVCLSQVSFLY